jgi:flavin reductase (DIM6/NTAB) family NADH-FMN oxidoreductase RutF
MEKQQRPSEPAQKLISAMGMDATGVSVVTTAGGAGRFGLTAGDISSVSATLLPPTSARPNRWSIATALSGASPVTEVKV